MNAKHIVPGFDDPTCGIAVAAKQLIARGVGEDDEVWVHSMWTPMVVKASIKVLLTGKKLVRMPHGCTAPEKLRYHWYKKRWITPIERWLFRHADRLIATCEDEIEWIKAFEPNVKKIDVVHLSSTGLGEFSRKKHTDRKGGEMRLLYVGRLHPLKGVEFLLETMHQLQESRNPLRPMRSLRLRIIGKDEGECKKLLRMTTDYNLNAEFCGIVSEKDKEASYQWCDVLVLPTLSENFGLVVAEALERGKPVITTDGAPVWEPKECEVVKLWKCGSMEVWKCRDGRLIYLKGYRDGTRDNRIELLKNAITSFAETLKGEK